MPTEPDIAVVCVLHGDPVVPDWLRAQAPRLHLVVNDPVPGAYADLPPARDLHVNDRVLGFAANVNAAAARTSADVLVFVNFDLEMAPDVPDRLARELAQDASLAIVGPLMVGPDGQPVLSAGGWPTPLKEFTRAAGLRTGAVQRVVRAALRRSGSWSARNTAGRVLGPTEYVPWTCVAVPRSAWDAVGPLDERFEMYAEDIDWGRRAVAAGWHAAIADVGTVVHEERATRSARTDALYEASHVAYHEKWGLTANARWHRRGLAVRRMRHPDR